MRPRKATRKTGQYFTLGEYLRDARERRGLSQYHVANASGVSQSLISKIESGVLMPDLRLSRLYAEQVAGGAWLEFLGSMTALL